MSQGPENRFISSVHDKLPPVSEFYRMKNHNEYNGGIADCWYSAKRDLWIEWKFVAIPVRDETVISIVDGKKPALSLLQQEWIRSRVCEGRNVWVGVGSVLRRVILGRREFVPARIVGRREIRQVFDAFLDARPHRRAGRERRLLR